MIVVIPTMYFKHLENFFREIENIDLKYVKKIFLFNNTPNNYKVDFEKFHVFNLGRNLGVNAIWNHGLKIAESENNDLMLLNDDVQFKPDFFTKTYQAIEENRQFAVVCPLTFHIRKNFLENPPDYSKRYDMMRKRNGWAFTINKSFIPTIPLMPRGMEIFFGDDWIWHFTRQLWIRDNSNCVYHHVGKTLKKNKQLRARYHIDKRLYKIAMEKICNENPEQISANGVQEFDNGTSDII